MPRITVNGRERFEENLHKGVGYYIEIKNILFEKKADQYILLFESIDHGKVLVIDESIQLTEREESTYHEAIVFVPLFAHENPQRVLIIGGGDGGVAAHVLMHPSVSKVVQVEIDNQVVEISKEHLKSVHKGAFDDKRHQLIIADGADYVANTRERFDVVIVDCSDPDPDQSHSNSLFSREFYLNSAAVLERGGIMVTQSGMPNLQAEELSSSVLSLRRAFKYATTYLVDSPMYGGGNIAISFATDNLQSLTISGDLLAERFAASRISAEHYTPDLHRAMFTLPRKVLDLIGGRGY